MNEKVLMRTLDQETIDEVMKLLYDPDTFSYDNPKNVWDTHADQLENLKSGIIAALSEYTDNADIRCEMDGWLVTTEYSNTHLQLHNHKEHGDVVCTFYACNDNPVGDGKLELITQEGELSVDPYPGLLVLFPANVEHKVTPYKGLRLAVATNIGIL